MEGEFLIPYIQWTSFSSDFDVYGKLLVFFSIGINRIIEANEQR